MKKRIFALISMILCAVMIFQSVPVSAIVDALDAEEAELSTEITSDDIVQAEETAEYVPFILGEVTDERTETAKVFRMSDGSYTAAVYPTQVHYEENGEMKEIDYSFEEVTVSGETFLETKQGPVSLRVPETIGEDSEVIFSSGEHSISFSLSSIEEIEGETFVGETDLERIAALRETIYSEMLTDEKFEEIYSKAKEKATVLDIALTEAVKELSDLVMSVPGASSSVSYESVMNGIDLNYSVSGAMLKEEIVLNRQSTALKTFSFTLDAGELTPILNSDNSVSLNDSEGEEQLNIAAPFMYDKIGAESSDIAVELTKNADGTYTYKLTPDKKWLGSAARIFPVTIDPPVTDSNFYTVKDTTGVFASNVGSLSNTGELNYLKVGKRYDSVTGTTPEVQAMLYSQLPEAITYSTNIIHAYLYLYSYTGGYSSCPSEMQINAYMMTTDWNTSNVMENAPAALGSNGRADYSNVLDYIYYSDSDRQNKIYRFEITEAAQKWLDGTNPNYGIALRASGLGSSESFARFFDSTNRGEVDTSGNTLQPRFVYHYRDSKGIEDHWTFTTMEAGRTGVVGVNNYNGNVVLTQPLVSSTGNNMPVSVSLIYSANSKDDGRAGLGAWRTNYHHKIETCDLTFNIPGAEEIVYKYCYIDSDGTRHYLKQEQNGEHKDEENLGLTLTVIENDLDYKYQIKTKDHTVLKFDHFGRLGLITDSNGNFNYIRYASYTDSSISRILYVEEGTDMSTTRRRTTFTLDEATGDITVTSPEGSFVKLDFISATNRMLQYIIYEDNINTSFEFTLIGAGYFPTKITDGKGHKTTISYISGVSKRVVALQWGTETSTLEQYLFTYNHNSTKITDIEGRATTLQFNGYGQTIGIVDHTSSIGQNYSFGAPGGAEKGTENQLLSSSKAIYASENRIKGGGLNISASIDNFSAPSAVNKSYSWGKGNTGTGRMRLEKAAVSSTNCTVYQNITDLIPGGKYTLSAYVSTNGTELTGTGVCIAAEVYGGNQYLAGPSSPRIKYTKEGEWTRLQTTVIVPSGATRITAAIIFFANTTGVVYVDDIQLEHNFSGGAGSFNQLTNPSMYTLDGWVGSTASATLSAVPESPPKPSGLKNMVTVTGDTTDWKTLAQTVYVDGKEGDVFIAGAWAKANSVPIPPKSEGGIAESYTDRKKGTPQFGLHVTFYNGDTKVGDTYDAQFNSGCEDWQFLADKVIASGTYTKVEFKLVYNYNTGTASFSSPFLYKENYGQSYVYNEEGDVVSATDRAETEATFAYQDNELTSSLSPTGSRYMYANSDTTQNTIYAVSNSGQKINFGYNGSGDATSMEIKDIEFISELEYTSGETVTCYIMNAKNGRVLKPHSVSDDSVIYVQNFDYSPSEKWQLRYISGSVYYVKSPSLNGAALATAESGETFKLDMLTYNTSGTPNVPFKFAIEPNDDGTFKISTASSNHTKYLYQTDNLHYDGSNSYSLRVDEYDENDPAFKWYIVAVTNSTMKMRTEAVYDEDGSHLISSTDAVGNTVEYTYGSNGLVEEVIGPPEPDSNIKTVTKYTYDNMGNPTKVESVERETDSETEDSTDTVVAEVSYTYDKDLLKKILVDEGLVQYSFDHDSYGRKVAAYVGNGTTQRTLASYVYEGRDLVRQNYGSSGTNYISFEYDSLDRPVKKTYNGDSSKYVEYLYDPNGNQYGVLDNIWGKGTYLEFDLAGRVNGVSTVDLSTKITRAYESVRYNDGKGTVESMAHTMFNSLGEKLRTTSYSFTYGDPSRGQIPDMIYSGVFGGRGFAFTYDKLGRLNTRTILFTGDDGVETYTYLDSETNGYTTTVVESMTDFTGKTHTYTYDANGNILTDTYDGNTVSYEYDNLNRMTRYNDPVFGWTYVYVYDDRGNILEMQEYAYTDGELGMLFNTYEYEYGDSTWADLMTSYWGEEIVYDELGNPLNWINGETLTWQNGRQLASINGVTYSYTADGLRTGKSGAKNTEYYIVNGTYLGETTTINGTTYTLSYFYDENGSPAGIWLGNTVYYFAKNLQGDVTAILDYQGNVVANYRYDAYGYLLSVTDASGNDITSSTHIANLNPFRYRGYMYDSESGFYYLRSRYYDPYIGRFLNADLLIQSDIKESNLFIYGKNNPVKYGDSGGLDAYILYDKEAAIGAGHIGLLIEDDEGQWWHFYWGCSVDLTIPFMPLGSFVTVDTWLVRYDGELTIDAINSSGQYKVPIIEDTYEYMIKFEGDFSDSVNAARAIAKMDGKLAYSLYLQNCTEVSMSILAESDTEYTGLFIEAKKIVIPKKAHKKVAIGKLKSDFRKGRGLLPVPGILRPFRPI